MKSCKAWVRFCSGVLMSVAAFSASASLLVTPHTAARDGDLAGAASADPVDAGSASLANPAGVVGPLSHQIVGAIATINFTARYSNPDQGFDQISSETPMFLNAWYGLGEVNGWSMGLSLYGSAGTAFNFAADGLQDAPYLGKLGLINFGFLIGRQLTPRLAVGLQIAPNLVHQSVKLPTPLGQVDFDSLRGLGIDGALGLVYQASDRLSLGLAYRSRGYSRLKGDGTVGEVKQDLELQLYTPQSVTGGLAFKGPADLTLFAQAKWSRYSDFELGSFEFEKSDMLDQPFISDARNRVRYWAALEYEGLENQTLRIGYTYEEWMIEPSAMRPTLFDTADSMLMLGYEVQHERFNLGFTYGLVSGRPRTISEAENPFFPGTYSNNIRTGFGVHLTWHI